MRLSVVIFIKKIDQSHLKKESFTIVFVSNASAQLFSDNTLSSFTNFLSKQRILEGQREVAFSEKAYASLYQNVTEGKFIFFDEKHFTVV